MIGNHSDRFIWLLALALFAAGCDQPVSDRNEVSGQVSIGGKPVTDGQVVFQSKSGPEMTIANIDPQGHYFASDVPPGELMVAVRTKDCAMTYGPPNKHTAEVSLRKNPLYVPIPERYEDVNTSGLTFTTKPRSSEPQTFDIELQSK